MSANNIFFLTDTFRQGQIKDGFMLTTIKKMGSGEDEW